MHALDGVKNYNSVCLCLTSLILLTKSYFSAQPRQSSPQAFKIFFNSLTRSLFKSVLFTSITFSKKSKKEVDNNWLCVIGSCRYGILGKTSQFSPTLPQVVHAYFSWCVRSVSSEWQHNWLVIPTLVTLLNLSLEQEPTIGTVMQHLQHTTPLFSFSLPSKRSRRGGVHVF